MGVFNRSQRRRIEMSVHNLSHNVSGTYYPGYIYPIMATKVVPGDTFQIASSPFLRSQPFVSPLMTNVHVDIRYFYCRNLLLWENFDKYITNADKYGVGYLEPMYRPVHPAFNFTSDQIGGYEQLGLFDNLYGVVDDPNGVDYIGIDSLPARMYNLIYNEYYNNENYGEIAPVFHDDYSDAEANSIDNQTNYFLRKGCYRKDYFTSMLPSPQRGGAVQLPSNVVLQNLSQSAHQNIVDREGRPLSIQGQFDGVYLIGHEHEDSDTIFQGYQPNESYDPENAFLDPNGTFGVSINLSDLRKASAVQRFLERSAVNGNRYAEYMLAHFGVRTPDNSSFRPQYLGGGSSVVNYTPVEQNSETSGTPQGTLAGKGTLNGLVGMNHRYFFTEYGWIMALMVIRPDADYFGGVNRQFWVNGDRLENYYNPVFQNIGMQGVKRKELSVGFIRPYDPEDVEPGFVYNDDDIGYQERYMEYKNIPNSIHGELRKSTMNSWVASRDMTYGQTGDEFGINEDFMQVQPGAFDANSAVQKFPPFIVQIRHNVIARRPMQYHAKYGGAL